MTFDYDYSIPSFLGRIRQNLGDSATKKWRVENDAKLCGAIFFEKDFSIRSFTEASQNLSHKVFITTHNNYKKILKQLYITAEPLPLFGTLCGIKIYPDNPFCFRLQTKSVFVDESIYLRWREENNRRWFVIKVNFNNASSYHTTNCKTTNYLTRALLYKTKENAEKQITALKSKKYNGVDLEIEEIDIPK